MTVAFGHWIKLGEIQIIDKSNLVLKQQEELNTNQYGVGLIGQISNSLPNIWSIIYAIKFFYRIINFSPNLMDRGIRQQLGGTLEKPGEVKDMIGPLWSYIFEVGGGWKNIHPVLMCGIIVHPPLWILDMGYDHTHAHFPIGIVLWVCQRTNMNVTKEIQERGVDIITLSGRHHSSRPTYCVKIH